MSNLTDLYNESSKQRPSEAKQIPGQETDMWDVEHTFADGFTSEQKQSSPTEYTNRALDQYNADKAELVLPESFNAELPLHRYTPETPFYDPGAGE